MGSPLRQGAAVVHCSGRLAAKPTHGPPVEEKAQLILLKWGSIMLHNGPPPVDDLQQYREIDVQGAARVLHPGYLRPDCGHQELFL